MFGLAVCELQWIQSSWGQHRAHLSPVGPRWDPCRPHEPCYQGGIASLALTVRENIETVRIFLEDKTCQIHKFIIC